MHRDFIFILKGLEPTLLVRGAKFFLLSVHDELKARLMGLDAHHKSVGAWFASPDPLFFAIIRNSIPAADDAFEAAYDSVAGICDSYMILRDKPPKISPVVGLREGDKDDAAISFTFETNGRVTWGLPEGAADRWRQRNEALLQTLLPCFDLAMAGASATELSEQVQLSLKMYRHGASAAAVGIEFLCKMSALEGLVCGNERNRKEQLLKDRIGALIRDGTDWNSEISVLWKLRCGGSHTGAAFSPRFAGATAAVDFMFVAVVMFAAENLSSIADLRNLWQMAQTYQLPHAALLKREGHAGRATRANMDPGLTWKGAGAMIDEQFRLHASGS